MSDALVAALMRVYAEQPAPAAGSAAAGPPAPPSKLEQLAHNQEEAQPPEIEKPDILKQLAPLLVAQAMDLLSTEKPFGFLAHSPSGPGAWSSGEANPLPGMQSTAGRLGWGAGEALLATVLLKHAPALGKAMVVGGNVAHNAMIGQNANIIRELDAMNRFQFVPFGHGAGAR